MELVKVTTGLFWLEIPEKNFYLMCGCPMDSIKHLTNKALIRPLQNRTAYTESGPNAILLSDRPVQNGYFCNMAEFPILHMMYKQGMSLPGHPGNTGDKPRIIGTENQLRAQKDYIFRGNYGLASKDEFRQAGCSDERTEELWRLKMKFSYNKILDPEELIETTVIHTEVVELKPGIFLERKGMNLYSLSCDGESLDINLNIDKEERYEAPYKLDYHNISREYFSIVHMGEGNGWDNKRPCMGSIIIFKGKIYMIDAGPNIEYSLNALGLSVNDVEGIFHTHIHDDHFSGLTYLLMADHKIKYFAAPMVMETTRKKLSALMREDESILDDLFDLWPLKSDEWNMHDGLEIKPVFSPHPVETTILYFRVKTVDGYKSYAHLADIVCKKILESFISEDPKTGITKDLFDKVWTGYHEKADIKKIDVGGGFVHGNSDDFIDDPSETLLLSHKDQALSTREKEIGESRAFGAQDILIPARKDYRSIHARMVLKDYFPEVDDSDLDVLLVNTYKKYKVGDCLAKKGELLQSITLILFGVVDYISGNKKEGSRKEHFEMTSGTLIGINSSICGKKTIGSYHASSCIETLSIPVDIMLFFLKKHNLLETLRDNNKIVQDLRRSYLFGSRISSRKLFKLSQKAELLDILPGEILSQGWSKDLYFIKEGSLEILSEGKIRKVLNQGESWGGFPVNHECGEMDITVRVSMAKSTKLYHLPHNIIKETPIVQWKLFQLCACWDASYTD
ncbi:MAG: hypothetical protein B6241_03975 [Spirochaetaceae bacterium 4572_59]|nr:MAG: hypothetical protein B6241_03975 [Spirochaetaceae bacterium 4572_59]